MNQFLSEIQEKYTKIVKNAILIGFLNRLVFPPTLTDSQPLDSLRYLFLKVEVQYRQISELPSDGFVDTFMKYTSQDVKFVFDQSNGLFGLTVELSILHPVSELVQSCFSYFVLD